MSLVSPLTQPHIHHIKTYIHTYSLTYLPAYILLSIHSYIHTFILVYWPHALLAGTGIVGMLSKRLGADHVLLTDNDPRSIAHMQQDCVRNAGVDASYTSKSYPLVHANCLFSGEL